MFLEYKHMNEKKDSISHLKSNDEGRVALHTFKTYIQGGAMKTKQKHFWATH